MPKINEHFIHISSVKSGNSRSCFYCDLAETTGRTETLFMKQAYYSPYDLELHLNSTSSLTEGVHFIKPCSCDVFYHESCLNRKILFTLNVNCPVCFKSFPIMFNPESFFEKMKHTPIILFPLLFAVLSIIGITILASVNVEEKYAFWQIISIIAFSLITIISVGLTALLMYQLSIKSCGEAFDWAKVSNLKSLDGNLKIISLSAEKVKANMAATVANSYRYERHVNFDDLLIFKVKRVDRIFSLNSSKKQQTVIYLNKYNYSAAEVTNRLYSRWKTSTNVPRINLDLKEKNKFNGPMLRTSTLKNVIHIGEVRESKNRGMINLEEIVESSHKESNENSFSKSEQMSFDSRNITESSDDDVNTFSDDKINQIFGLGKYREWENGGNTELKERKISEDKKSTKKRYDNKFEEDKNPFNTVSRFHIHTDSI